MDNVIIIHDFMELFYLLILYTVFITKRSLCIFSPETNILCYQCNSQTGQDNKKTCHIVQIERLLG